MGYLADALPAHLRPDWPEESEQRAEPHGIGGREARAARGLMRSGISEPLWCLPGAERRRRLAGSLAGLLALRPRMAGGRG
jgi:hypothetical protein